MTGDPEDKIKSSIPFVGLHGHSGFSLFDGFSFPADHFDFAYSNGLEGHALTEHGNMNSFSYAWNHTKKMKKEGKTFKYIKGVEAYYIPSFSKWREQYEAEKEAKKEAKLEDLGSFTENEEETKSSKPKSTINRKSHLVILAKNQQGLTNLFKLVSQSFRPEHFYRAPRIDLEMLRENRKGLIISTACLGGAMSNEYWKHRENGETAVLDGMTSVAQDFLDVFGEDFYCELQWNAIPEQHEVNQNIIKVARKLGIKLISTADSHYPNPDAWNAREVYKRLNPAFHHDEPIPESRNDLKYELYPKNGDQMWESFKTYSSLLGQTYDEDEILQSIKETHKIAFEKIEDYDIDTKPKLPSFITKGQDENELLEIAAWKGFHEKTKDFPEDKKKKYEDQLKYELEVIKDRKFAGYFLTTKAFIDYAKTMMLVGLGRGSCAGSILAYVLGLTQVDPIRWNLSFARFMRKDATDFPDIDSDFADNAYLKEKLVELWGEDSVVSITNWNTLKLKSTLKDLARFFEIPFEEVNTITKKMMKEAMGPAKKKHGITAGVYEPTYEELLEFSPSFNGFLKTYPKIKEYVERILGEIKSAGAHAGGVLISENLNEKMPLIYVKGTRQTPWTEGQTVRHLEPLGFIKFDLLGLGTLGVIQKCIERILLVKLGRQPEFHEIREWYENHLSPDVLDLEDKQVFHNIFHEGKWLGIFQFTEKGAQTFCKEASPNNVEEISAITSLYRPGPLCLSGDTKIMTHYYTRSKRTAGYYEDLRCLYRIYKNKKNGYKLPIISINEKTGVLEKNKISKIWKSGKKDVYEVFYYYLGEKKKKTRTSSMRSYATLEHYFLTLEGWKQLKELTEKDYICVRNQGFKIQPRKNIKSIWGKKNFRNICYRHHKYECLFCDWDRGSLDVNHIEGNRNTNNKHENLCFLCPNHHREFSEGSINLEEVHKKNKENTFPFVNENVSWVRFSHKEKKKTCQTYDIEVEGVHNNFFAGNFIVHNSSNAHKTYINVKSGKEDRELFHPIIDKILEPTYGILVFQEQLAEIAWKMGKGIDEDEANLLRKVLTKKGTGKEDEVKQRLWTKFLDGCLEKGMKKERVEEIWNMMIKFAGYAFNACLHEDELVSIYSPLGNWMVDKKIKDVLPGEYVRSRNEETKKDIYIPVIENHRNGLRKTFLAIMEGGERIRCTRDHKFRTESGKMISMGTIEKKGLSIVGNSTQNKVLKFFGRGENLTFDLEVDHPDHQFYLANGLLTSNSHSVSYSLISYQCAYLATHHQTEWICAFLDYETEKDTPQKPRKEKAISLVRSLGYKVALPDINKSGTTWTFSDGSLIQPFTTIKGLGKTGIEEILNHRPFNTIEELLFHPEIKYSKLNKKCFDALCRSGSLKSLQDDRFSGDKHFWSVVAVDRPKTVKKLEENIEKYRPEGSFTAMERIAYQISLMGSLPMGEIISDKMMVKFQKLGIPSITDLEENSGRCWGILTDFKIKMAKNGRPYVDLEVMDDSFQTHLVRCWNTDGDGRLFHYKPYLLELDYEFGSGYTVKKIDKGLVLLGLKKK